jgi:hypothetical protein
MTQNRMMHLDEFRFWGAQLWSIWRPEKQINQNVDLEHLTSTWQTSNDRLHEFHLMKLLYMSNRRDLMIGEKQQRNNRLRI